MSRFVEGLDRSQVTLIPECLDDFIAEDNPVRVVDAFVAELDLSARGFEGTTPKRPVRTGWRASSREAARHKHLIVINKWFRVEP